jgi:tripartite-type tricarboxylate transporter receptor subunit TctC
MNTIGALIGYTYHLPSGLLNCRFRSTLIVLRKTGGRFEEKTVVGARHCRGLVRRRTADVPGSFSFISSFASYPLVVGVSPKLPIHDLQEFIDYARSHPGKLHYASSGAGGGGHLYPAYIAKVIGADMVHVPFDGAAPAAVAVMGGFADFCDVAPSTVASYITAGTMTGVATSGHTRSSMLPNVPTMAELGHPDLAVDLYYGMLGPPGMPKEIIDKLRAGIESVLKQPGTADRLHSLGLEPLDVGEADFQAFVEKDAAQWNEIAKAVNIRIGG